MARVLIAYATKYGATQEVAEAIGDTLRGAGFDTDVRAARDVGHVDDYSAVVVGSALYYFMLRGDAKRSLSRNRKALASKPTALFALGPFHDTPDEMASARGPVDKFVEKSTWFQPRAVAVFGGRHDPSLLRFPDNNPAMRKMEPSDARDWEVIRAWAQQLPAVLGLHSS